MSDAYTNHFSRIEDGANAVYTLQTLSRYVEKNIKLDGKPYTFGDNYGFQRTIIDDASRVTNTVKPAQIGLTTSTMAYILAGAVTQPRFNCIYSLPTANDASKLVISKLDPLIQNSPELYAVLDKNVDNSEMKKFRNNFIYIRGSKSETAALSISADVLVADEIDRSDPDRLKQFRSRLQGSELQIIKQFSTPTLPKVGIDKEAQTSRRHRHLAKCNCCGYIWLPTYHADIIIPGYSGKLEEITSESIKNIQWQKAQWLCPHCKRDPQFHPSRLQWVCENPDENYEANTYYVTPVTACLVLRPAYLVRTSTEFNTRAEWANQVLGETCEDNNEQITETDVEACTIDVPLDSSEMHSIGADMGLVCSISVGRETQDGTLLVVYREEVPISNFHERLAELKKLYRVHTSAYDVYPYTPTIMAVTDADPNAYGVVGVKGNSPEMYRLVEKDEDKEAGQLNLRLLKINRTMVLDNIRDEFKARKILIHAGDKKEAWKGHYTSMKRVQRMSGDDLTYVWEKTDGVDHFFMSLAYLKLAIAMRQRNQPSVPAGLPLVSKFKRTNL